MTVVETVVAWKAEFANVLRVLERNASSVQREQWDPEMVVSVLWRSETVVLVV